MKILQLAKFPPSTFGGIEKLVNQLSTVLFSKEFRCDTLCFENNKKSSFEVFNTHTVYKARSLFTFQSTSFSIHHLYFLLKLRDSYDLFHLHLPNPLVCIYLLIFFPRSKIFTIHYHACTNYKKFFIINYLIEKPILKRAKKIIATSKSLSESPSLRLYKNKTCIIPLYLSDSDFNKPNITDCSTKVKAVIKAKKYIVFVGRLVNYKNIPIIIKSFLKSLFPDYNLILVGNGPEADSYRALISKLQIMKNVFLFDSIDNNEKRALFSSAEFSVLASTTSAEAFGFVQLESMAMGTPVLSFDIPFSGVSEVNKNMETGIVSPHSFDKEECIANLSSNMNLLKKDQNLLKKLSEGASKRALLFKKSKILPKYKKFFLS